jgi:hypothetical protein
MKGLAQLKGISNSTFNLDAKLDAITCKPDGTPFQHQIDLVWDFEIDGKKYRTVFQAKDWDQKLDRPILMAFCGVLTDLPGEPDGVIITRTGFNKPVLEYAKARGIGIYLLDDVSKDDFVSCVPTVEIKIDQVQDGYRLALLQTFHPTNGDGSYKEIDARRASDAALAMTSKPYESVEFRDANDRVVGTLATMLKDIHRTAVKDGLTLHPVSIHFRLNTATIYLH